MSAENVFFLILLILLLLLLLLLWLLRARLRHQWPFAPEYPVREFIIEDELVMAGSAAAIAGVLNDPSVRQIQMVEVNRLDFAGFPAPAKNCAGLPADYVIAALTPTPEQQPQSSLVFMISELMNLTTGVFLPLNSADPLSPLRSLWLNKKVFLIGLTYALLDLAESHSGNPPDFLIIETGGMKGRRKEMIREELHERLKAGFGVTKILSEYGMSELLSQAWSQGDGRFRCPAWMKVLIRDTNDPLSLLPSGQTGGINIIDLANIYSCPFIATQDLGKLHEDGSFEVLGRFDYSDVRGCSLMI